MPRDDFQFDLNAKRKRLSDERLMAALKAAAEQHQYGYFSTTQYDELPGNRPHSTTITARFGSWKNALHLLGISGARARQYDPEVLVANLETVWKHLGFPPASEQSLNMERGSLRDHIDDTGGAFTLPARPCRPFITAH